MPQMQEAGRERRSVPSCGITGDTRTWLQACQPPAQNPRGSHGPQEQFQRLQPIVQCHLRSSPNIFSISFPSSFLQISVSSETSPGHMSSWVPTSASPRTGHGGPCSEPSPLCGPSPGHTPLLGANSLWGHEEAPTWRPHTPSLPHSSSQNHSIHGSNGPSPLPQANPPAGEQGQYTHPGQLVTRAVFRLDVCAEAGVGWSQVWHEKT